MKKALCILLLLALALTALAGCGENNRNAAITSLEQLKADVKACSTPISDELMHEIDAIHAAMPNPAI